MRNPSRSAPARKLPSLSAPATETALIPHYPTVRPPRPSRSHYLELDRGRVPSWPQFLPSPEIRNTPGLHIPRLTQSPVAPSSSRLSPLAGQADETIEAAGLTVIELYRAALNFVFDDIGPSFLPSASSSREVRRPARTTWRVTDDPTAAGSSHPTACGAHHARSLGILRTGRAARSEPRSPHPQPRRIRIDRAHFTTIGTRTQDHAPPAAQSGAERHVGHPPPPLPSASAR